MLAPKVKLARSMTEKMRKELPSNAGLESTPKEKTKNPQPKEREKYISQKIQQSRSHLYLTRSIHTW